LNASKIRLLLVWKMRPRRACRLGVCSGMNSRVSSTYSSVSVPGSRTTRCRNFGSFEHRIPHMRGQVSPLRTVPAHIPRPSYAQGQTPSCAPGADDFGTRLLKISPWLHNAFGSFYKNSGQDIAGIRDACTLSAEALNMACDMAAIPGELESLVSMIVIRA
jgi:hypothetical protein